MLKFKEICESEYKQILDVYNFYIQNSTATFHLHDLTLDEIKANLPKINDIYKVYTIYFKDEFCGYCYLNNWKPRQAYNRSAEITLYLKPEFHGNGIGRKALEFLEEKAVASGLKNLLGVITLENTASIKLFEKMGYEKVGHMKNIGEKFGRLLDVVTYQKEI